MSFEYPDFAANIGDRVNAAARRLFEDVVREFPPDSIRFKRGVVCGGYQAKGDFIMSPSVEVWFTVVDADRWGTVTLERDGYRAFMYDDGVRVGTDSFTGESLGEVCRKVWSAIQVAASSEVSNA